LETGCPARSVSKRSSATARWPKATPRRVMSERFLLKCLPGYRWGREQPSTTQRTNDRLVPRTIGLLKSCRSG
jgi:hypothetical protein